MWFGNLPTSIELQGFHYYQGKIQSVAVPKPLLHGLSLKKSPIKNHAILYRVESSSGSNTTRLHKTQQISHWETSSITNINRNPPKTIPHPCNSSSCPQVRRLIETAHSFSFSTMTPLVNMSAGFLDP